MRLTTSFKFWTLYDNMFTRGYIDLRRRVIFIVGTHTHWIKTANNMIALLPWSFIKLADPPLKPHKDLWISTALHVLFAPSNAVLYIYAVFYVPAYYLFNIYIPYGICLSGHDTLYMFLIRFVNACKIILLMPFLYLWDYSHLFDRCSRLLQVTTSQPKYCSKLLWFLKTKKKKQFK